MGFKEARRKVIECLRTGYVLHEERNNIDIKNLIATGIVSIDDATRIIGRSSGDDYYCTPHHFDEAIDVHVIKTRFNG